MLNSQEQDVIYTEEFVLHPELRHGCLGSLLPILLLSWISLSFAHSTARDAIPNQSLLHFPFHELTSALIWLSYGALVLVVIAVMYMAYQAYRQRPYEFGVEVDSQQIRYSCYGNDYRIPLRSIQGIRFSDRDPGCKHPMFLNGPRALLVDVDGPRRLIVPTQQPELLAFAIDRALWTRE